MNNKTTDKVQETGSAEDLQRVIPVVFAANDRYAPYAGVAIASLIAHVDPQKSYRIFMLHTGISHRHIEMLEALSTANVTVCCLNVEKAMSTLPASLPEVGHISRESYYRLLIPKLDALNVYPYVVYLDCDIIVNSDIAGIIPDDMGDSLLAGVCDLPQQMPACRERLERDYHLNAEQYINAGVLVFNVGQWMEEGTADRCFEYLNNLSGKFLYMDQDTINIICENRIYYLDIPWNYHWYLLYGEEEFVEKCRPITERIGDSFHVLHYTTEIKPWNMPERSLSRYFWKYASQSPFFEEILTRNVCIREAETLRNENRKLKVKLDRVQYDLDCVHASVSFRVGRAITWAPRKLRGGVRCFQDNGAGYTLRRALFHVGLWEDEEAPESPENRPKLISGAERFIKGKREKKKG